MKRILFIPFLFLFSVSFGQLSNLAVEQKNRLDQNYINLTEGQYVNIYSNSTGASGFPTSGTGTTGVQWKTATPATTVANTWFRAQVNAIWPNCGRKIVVTRITINTTAAAQLGLFLQSYINSSGGQMILDPAITAITNINAAGFYVRDQPSSTGGETVFDFSANPLIVKSGQKIDFYYNVTGTTGINWQFNYEGYEMSNDENYGAPFKFMVLGDSICGFTTDAGATQYTYREDGTTWGSWPYIVQQSLLRDKIDTYQRNVGVGGTSSPQWDYWFSYDKYNFKGIDLLAINLGMNDATTPSYLTTVAGTDGIYKKSMKAIIRKYFEKNPNGACVVNNITSTDVTNRLTTVSGGIYNGYTQLAAYQAECAALVSDLNTSNPLWDLKLAPMNTAYTSAQTTYFIQPRTAGTNLHPNTTLGQPAMAIIFYNTVKTTKFWLKNHKSAVIIKMKPNKLDSGFAVMPQTALAA
jgi:lysophospholipase L1-like esterase